VITRGRTNKANNSLPLPGNARSKFCGRIVPNSRTATVTQVSDLPYRRISILRVNENLDQIECRQGAAQTAIPPELQPFDPPSVSYLFSAVEKV
jgi:hypothetical protein